MARRAGAGPSVPGRGAAGPAGVGGGRRGHRGVRRAAGPGARPAGLPGRDIPGLQNTVPYGQAPPGRGVFEPTAPTPPVDLVLIQVRPLALGSAGQFRPAGPPALTSARYARDLAEVARLGREDSTERSPDQTTTALFWSEQTAQQWSRALVQLAGDRKLSLGAGARMLLTVHVAAADAVIGCWDARFHYLRWRPMHAIPRADTDGNPRTVADRGWQPLRNAKHPEYPSGHACFTSAATSALRAFFGTDAVPVESQHGHDVREARILSGLHFRHSMVDGGLPRASQPDLMLRRLWMRAAVVGRST